MAENLSAIDVNAVLSESEPLEDGWQHRCGALLLAARVHHSVWTMPEACAGSGEVRVQEVPYCPRCHEKPSPYGDPIMPTTTAWPRVLIRRSRVGERGS